MLWGNRSIIIDQVWEMSNWKLHISGTIKARVLFISNLPRTPQSLTHFVQRAEKTLESFLSESWSTTKIYGSLIIHLHLQEVFPFRNQPNSDSSSGFLNVKSKARGFKAKAVKHKVWWTSRWQINIESIGEEAQLCSKLICSHTIVFIVFFIHSHGFYPFRIFYIYLMFFVVFIT